MYANGTALPARPYELKVRTPSFANNFVRTGVDGGGGRLALCGERCKYLDGAGVWNNELCYQSHLSSPLLQDLHVVRET